MILVRPIVHILALCLIGLASGANIQNGVSSNTMNIGVLLPWTGEWTVGQQIGSAVVVAIQDITALNLMPAGVSIEWQWIDTKCQALDGMIATMRLWNETDDLDAFIGGGCSIVCQPAALVAASMNLPFVSFGCSADSLSDKSVYPTFTRTVGPWTLLAPFVDAFLEAMNWKTRVGIVSTHESIMISTANAFKNRLESESIDHTQKEVIYMEMPSNRHITFRDMAKYMMARVRVIIILMYNNNIHDFLLAARDEGMMEGDYAFITVNADLNVPVTSNRVEDATYSYNGIIDLHVEVPTGAAWNTFAARVVSAFGDSAFTGFPSIGPSAALDQVDVHAMFLYDALLAWAYGVNASVYDNPAYVDDGVYITSKIRNHNFPGILNDIRIDDNGDRQPEFSFSLVQNLARVPLFVYRENIAQMFKIYKPADPNDFTELEWKGGRSGPPAGHPKCGWYHELCDKNLALKVSLSVLFVLIAGFVIGFFVYRRWVSYRDMMDTKLWKINKSDMGPSKFHNQLAMSREVLKTKTRTNVVDTDEKQMFCSVVIAKGKLCAVKQLNSPTVNANDRGILLEMQQMRELNHENVNSFVAAVCEHPYVSVLMMYAEKGSLQDVIFNDNVNLSWDFQLSFAYDIAQGMNYLHGSPFGSHGHLTSANCVVDARWVCKITDYGCARFKENHISKLSQNRLFGDLLWTAPELLPVKLGEICGVDLPYGTKRGDTYSYSIILQELAMRDRPFVFELETMEAKEVVEKVLAGTMPFFRPSINADLVRHDWQNLMALCWDEDPDRRPTFKTIIHSLRTMNDEQSFSLVDRMVTLLEEHSQRLEELAADRMDQIEVEKKRVASLLSNLLPPPVSKILTEGNVFMPHRIQSASVVFCKITNVEQIATDYQAADMVDILNDVCTCFEETALDYDIIKVESISSGQIFSSGCPVPREKHELEVAEFSLKLLGNFASWTHPRFPDLQISIRMGLNSGPIVEGIIGLKVPRYCLFGETVRVAMQLEGAADEMCVHITENTAKLFQVSGFKLTPGPGLALNHGSAMSTFYLKRVGSSD